MNILIIRLSAIGDIVMSSPIAETIKHNIPNAQITWLVQPENASLLKENPNINEIITWDKSAFKKLLKEKKFRAIVKQLLTLKDTLQSKNFDICVDLQGLLKSGILAKLSGAKKVIGLGSKEGSQWLVDENISRKLGDTEMISSEYRTITQHLVKSDTFNLKNHYSESTRKSADQKLRTILPRYSDTGYFVFCPFTTRPQKHWFDDYWQTLGDKLSDLGIPMLILGGPGDKHHAFEITNKNNLLSLTGQTTLLEASAIIDQSLGVIGVDTGLTHMGHAAQVPTLCLFGATKPYLKSGLPKSHVLYYPKLCTQGKHDSRAECDGCMRDLTPDIVADKFRSMIIT